MPLKFITNPTFKCVHMGYFAPWYCHARLKLLHKHVATLMLIFMFHYCRCGLPVEKVRVPA